MIRRPVSSRRPEAGGITILVSLMLLVLLTVAALGMSHNSIREVIASGTARQGSMVRNAADSGIEWAIYWGDPANSSTATGSAGSLVAQMSTLLQNDLMSGVPYDPLSGNIYDPQNPPAPPSDLTLPTSLNGSTLGFTTALTRMGKVPITDMGQGAGTGAYAPGSGGDSPQAPDFWAVRSDAQLKVGSGLTSTTFHASKEAWISTPITAAQGVTP